MNWSYHKEWAHKNPLAPLHCIRAIQYVIRDYTDKTLGSMYSKTFPATNLLPGLRLSITWMRKNSENNGGLYTIAWAGPTLCLRMASSTGQFTVGYMKITNRWNLMVQKRPKSKKHLIWLSAIEIVLPFPQTSRQKVITFIETHQPKTCWTCYPCVCFIPVIWI